MITDISLKATDSEIANNPPDISNPFIAEVIAGTATYGELHVLPMLTIGGAAEILEGPQPVKSLPAHFSRAKQSSPRDIELVFGKEDERQFWVGTPLDMETKICDLPYQAAAHRYSAKKTGCQPCFRYAQRIWLGRRK